MRDYVHAQTYKPPPQSPDILARSGHHRKIGCGRKGAKESTECLRVNLVVSATRLIREETMDFCPAISNERQDTSRTAVAAPTATSGAATAAREKPPRAPEPAARARAAAEAVSRPRAAAWPFLLLAISRARAWQAAAVPGPCLARIAAQFGQPSLPPFPPHAGQ